MAINLEQFFFDTLDELTTHTESTVGTFIESVLDIPARFHPEIPYGAETSAEWEQGYRTPGGHLIPWRKLMKPIPLYEPNLQKHFGIPSMQWLLANTEHLDFEHLDRFLEHLKSQIIWGMSSMLSPITGLGDMDTLAGEFIYYRVPKKVEHRRLPIWSTPMQQDTKEPTWIVSRLQLTFLLVDLP